MSTEVATIADRQELAPASPLAALVTDTERLKELPIETVERLFELHERHEATEARKTFAAAFRAVQEAMRPVAERAEGHKGNRYAPLADINRMLRPLLAEQGFSTSFSHVDGAPEGQVRMQLLLRHLDGHVEQHCMNLPMDVASTKTKSMLQAMGSTNTYGARYLTASVFGVIFGPDDDGKAASTEPITEKQRVELSDLLAQTGSDPSAFVDIYGVKSLADLPAANYKGAKMVLQTRIARAKSEPKAEAKTEEPAVDRLNRKMVALRADKGSRDEWLALNNEAIEAGLTFDDRAGRYVDLS